MAASTDTDEKKKKKKKKKKKNMMPNTYTMLLPFLYDTSSFSDRQVQIAIAITTQPAPKKG
ncbi:hypothetical protein NW759_004172 [Fusarium solani]|nr:hypothetical protein NW759_004172 [Fusarium solani]